MGSAGSVGDGGNVIRKDPGGCRSLSGPSVGGGVSLVDAPGDAAEVRAWMDRPLSVFEALKGDLMLLHAVSGKE